MGEYDHLKVAELKEILIDRLLSTDGVKSVLIDRLEWYDKIQVRRKSTKKITWDERIENFEKETGYSNYLFHAADGWIAGTWVMGGDYTVESGYYGGYPAGYLRRIKALFPEKNDVLHVFSGKVDLGTLPGAVSYTHLTLPTILLV